MNPCECTQSGFCTRHNVKKTDAMVRLCKLREAYWIAWEQGRGPGQRSQYIPTADNTSEIYPTVQYNHWIPLHYFAVKHAECWIEAKAMEFYDGWQQNIPNTSGCSCSAKWQSLGISPDYSSPKAFFEWTVHAHNTVSRLPEINKPHITVEEAYAIWWKANAQSAT